MANRSIPSIKVLHSIFFDEEKCIEFLFEKDILFHRTICQNCQNRVSRNGTRFRCTRYACKKSVSIFHRSFFSGNRVKCNEILHLAYLWLTGCSSETMLLHLGNSSATICSYRGYFRQLVSEMVETDDMIIGGPGIIVQVDETKMGKRKYHRGHRVDGAWVIVGVEMTEERLVFAEVVSDRSEETISRVLERHVAQGSILWTDMWRGYSSISHRFEIEHQTVNHSRWFTDPNTGINTNTIEGTNYALKRWIPPRNRTEEHLPSHLMEFIWRRKHVDHLWDSFIGALKEIDYID